ncbi:hypothetical protein BpHYR1_043832 [Brachionus plicatilis]|uniref:Uncharacterized protein n=1 Tax=Brachionus plicatilis TaxID=10195 RepID=A0A3M7RWI2_BRAPC|nr:hypothetical protein BpHYR1_043832 [Brachionus plicatilis]
MTIEVSLLKEATSFCKFFKPTKVDKPRVINPYSYSIIDIRSKIGLKRFRRFQMIKKAKKMELYP